MGNLGNYFRLLEVVPRNINARGASGEVSDRNEEHIFLEIGGNVIFVIKWQNTRLHCGSTILWKLELLCDELISPYCYDRMQEKRKKLKNELLSRM